MKNDRVSLQRRPFLIPIWLVGIAGAAAFVVAVLFVWIWATADSTTVIVALAPSSNAAGEARAASLQKMLSDDHGTGHVDAIYVSSNPRNPAIGAPWASHLSKLPTLFAGEDPRRLAKRALREHSGGRVMIIGDADVGQKIVAMLSGHDDAVSNDWDNDALYIITVPRIGHANLLRLNY